MTDRYAKYNASAKGRARAQRYRDSHKASRAVYMVHWRATTMGILDRERQQQRRRLNHG
jgi:hypothetical protein